MKVDRVISVYCTAWLIQVNGRQEKNSISLTSSLPPSLYLEPPLVSLRVFGKIKK